MFLSEEKKVSYDLNEGLINLANKHKMKKSKNFKLKRYQIVELSIYDQQVLKDLLVAFKFKDAGNIYDYPDLPQPDTVRGNGAIGNFELFNRIGISKKYNSLVFFNKGYWSINCRFIISIKHLEKFMRIAGDCILNDETANDFKDTDFTCGKNHYIEITNSYKDETKEYDVIRKSLSDENLVFDKKSTISRVISDIDTFFSEKTEKLYNRLSIAYKRGIILYGDPGNGKSAMIRQIIRTGPDVIKIIINSGIRNVTTVISALVKALEGQKAIIIMEDIDSLITPGNRSEFLNTLDGVDVKSGLYFIGTTNYPERLDPAIMNRSGRFDRTYKIDNPTEAMRKLYFESRELGDILSEYKLSKHKRGSSDEIIDVFVKYSHDLPMANLKEIITGTAYLLASGEEKYIESAVKQSFDTLFNSREGHKAKHDAFERSQMVMGNYGTMRPVGQPITVQFEDNKDEDIIGTDEKGKEVKIKMVKIKRVKDDGDK